MIAWIKKSMSLNINNDNNVVTDGSYDDNQWYIYCYYK